MNDEDEKFPRGKFLKCLIVIAGILLGQAVLYGPSLIGQKILLPLDILAQPGVYIPQTPETAKVIPHNMTLSDLVYQFELDRQFAIAEMHHGRFPLWAPYQYGGVPFVWPKYSLFLLLECCTKSPVTLPWVQLFAALVAGVGMYFFCRKSLRVGFWPATICAWCYPLTAFFVLWQGFPTGLSVYWLPWIFLAVDKTIRGENPLAPMGLSLVTFLVLTSGDIDVAGQALLGSGIFALWCLWNARDSQGFARKFRKALVVLILGWGLGFLLAAPHILPLLEYAKTGSRMVQRSLGTEERPPTGLTALPQVVLPYIYGTSERGSTFIASTKEPNLLESAAAAYTGVLTTMLVAPLAWCDRRRRSLNLFWIFLVVFGLSWCLDLPGFVQLLRLPVLNMMSHNRLVFLTSFAILSLAAIGLENLLNGLVQRRWWFWLPTILLTILCGWCLYRSIVLPEPIANQLNFKTHWAERIGQTQITRNVNQVQAWFIRHYTIMAELCLLGSIGWLLLWFQKIKHIHLFTALAVFCVGDLLWFGCGRSAQCDPALYYPKIPVLNEIAQAKPGRVIGGLPAPLVMMQGLSDIRGYDSIDPARMVDILKAAAEPQSVVPGYAATLFLIPKGKILPPSAIKLSPLLDMLDVRYVVFRGVPPPSIHPPFQGNDYWALVNTNALPRAFVPKSVQSVADDQEQLAALTSPQFNPADVAYVESPVELPNLCRGAAQIEKAASTHVTISVQMQTPGLVVLADNWNKGWRAIYNGKPVPILRTDYTIRGVVVPAGKGTLKFIYKPGSLIVGLWLAGFATMILAGWFVIAKLRSH
jgi:hypothetical protein